MGLLLYYPLRDEEIEIEGWCAKNDVFQHVLLFFARYVPKHFSSPEPSDALKMNIGHIFSLFFIELEDSL